MGSSVVMTGLFAFARATGAASPCRSCMRTVVVALVATCMLVGCKSRVSSALVIEHPVQGCSSGDCVGRRTTPYVPGGCGGVKQPVPADLAADERVVACVEHSHLEPAMYPAVWVGVGVAVFLATGAVVFLL